MKTKTIYPPVEIFDDPEDCGVVGEFCKYRKWKNHHLFCHQFREWVGVDGDIGKKCDECKKYFNAQRDCINELYKKISDNS